jgi:hypothetical protein
MTIKLLLLGATGETGGDILNGLVEDGSFVSDCPHILMLCFPDARRQKYITVVEFFR